MGKRIVRVLVVLLTFSLMINFSLGCSSQVAKANEQELIVELCANITYSGTLASARIDQALENNDRKLALMAGVEICKLNGLIDSFVSREMGVRNTWGDGSLSSLADLIIFGNKSMELLPIGRSENSMPFTSCEVDVLQTISFGLKEFSLSFYPEYVTEKNYMHEPRLYSDINTINSALTELKNTTEHVINSGK